VGSVKEVLECVDVTDEFEPSFLSPGERIFRARYVRWDGEVLMRHVKYSPSDGFSPNPEARALQEVCMKLLGLTPNSGSIGVEDK
jgi:hypothetical protein